MAFGQDAKEEKAVATLESPIFENIPSQCWHFVFSLNVSKLIRLNESRHLSIFRSKTYKVLFPPAINCFRLLSPISNFLPLLFTSALCWIRPAKASNRWQSPSIHWIPTFLLTYGNWVSQTLKLAGNWGKSWSNLRKDTRSDRECSFSSFFLWSWKLFLGCG